jgi:hypothetical protein
MEYASAFRRQDNGGNLVGECRIRATLAAPYCNVSKNPPAAAADQMPNETCKSHRPVLIISE